MIKKVIRSWFRQIICKNDLIWNLLPIWLRNQAFLRVQRSVALEEIFTKHCNEIFNSSRVLSGPFNDLFPDSKIQGSAIFPRLLGSYESELHEMLENLIQKGLPVIIDIGFAEGYYLIGLGKRMMNSKLIGYDISPEAHELSKRLARANNFPLENMTLHSECNIENLKNYLPSRSLVICDCEGYEIELFSTKSKNLWIESDIIVECHDFITPGAEKMVYKVLKDTHRVSFVQTIATESKLSLLSGAKFDKLKLEEKLRLLDEGRPYIQRWLIAESNLYSQ